MPKSIVHKTALVINQFAVPIDQGGGTRHAELFGGLAKWNAVILAGNRNYISQRTYETSDSVFELIRVPKTSGTALSRLFSWLKFSFGAMLRGAIKRDIDLVYASTPHLLAPILGLALARIKQIPFVLEVRDLWPDTFVTSGKLSDRSIAYKILKACERIVARSAEQIVVVTEGWESHFRSLGVDPDKVTVIPNGAGPTDPLSAADLRRVRNKFALKGFTAVYAGAHGPANGLHLLLEAAKEAPEVDFILVGAGSTKADLVAECQRRELRNVRFIDPLPKPEVLELIAACDVGIHCLRHFESLQLGMSPNKLFDVMAAGVPVVTNTGKVGSSIVGGEVVAGLSVGERGLGAAVKQVMAMSDEEREAMGNAGRELIANHFARSLSVRKLESVLDEVVARRGTDGKND